MSKVKGASNQSTGLPTRLTPMPVVYAQTPSGEVWWNVEGDKWILKADSAEEIYELWNGSLCDEHGFEGTFASICEEWIEAAAWLCECQEQLHAGETWH